MHETEYALHLAAQSRRSNVVPVIVASFTPNALPAALAKIQWFDLTAGAIERRISTLIRSLKTREME